MPQKSSQVTYFNVGTDEIGQRLDNWLLARLKGVPRSRIYRIIRGGEVRVNKGRAKVHQRLAAGDVIRVPPVRMDVAGSITVPADLQHRLSQAVLYRDRNILVLNKPAGLAVHSGSGVRFGAIDVVRVLWGDDWQLVHRLDRETSGCLLLVRQRELQREFQAALAANAVTKEYQALVHGHWPAQCQRLETLLQKGADSSGERRVRQAGEAPSEGARLAVSTFDVTRLIAQTSLLRVGIETGRTHQIRVQVANAGHPIVGDSKYGRRALDQALGLPFKPGLCLHARSLALELGGCALQVQAPLPEGFESVLMALEGSN